MFLRVSALIYIMVAHLLADATIEVVKSVNKLTTVAVEDGTSATELKELAPKFYRLLINDLTVLTHFDVKDTNQQTDFKSSDSEFANRNVNYVIKFELSRDDQNNLSGKLRLFSNISKKDDFVKSYKIGDDEMYPFLAHHIVADINNHFSMPPVDWLTKYIIFARYTEPKKSEIVVADYTLTYIKTLIGNGLNLFPKWADDKQREFYFTRYNGSTPTLYKMNIISGSLEKILHTEGMLACSDVSADGKELLLTMAPEGQPDIFLYNIETKAKKALTDYQGIDVSGHFIENDSRITFVSDRLGFPNIYATNIRDVNQKTEQLVYYGKNNNSCSSFNNYIVYSSRETENAFSSNTFNLHLISTDTNYVRRLTASGINQFPKFSSDGESVLFIKHFKNQSSLGLIRLNYNKSFLFPLNVGKIQSIDW